ncbi:BQ2448_3390 [Microbotryum intermedium]|uniref:BQ2448_3390 protein n=1 Tax=Microbotryum intermedium TaxID=269621 RepID=A0A238FHJ5_9BASI|nr:BQ2448_3390 [Microbotryum intermedium]
MGGGDLNMKKSWHTGTFANKERVWKHEKSALEERKKLHELQKELEQERAVQELQRLQAEAGGKKRADRVDWMYAAPAQGNGPNAEELEAYLLGKKRVDKLLKGNEEKLMSAPSADAPGGSFTALQNANTARDTAAKIRNDPLLAIKRQEQLQYEKLLKNPRRLKELRDREVGSRTPGQGHVERKSKKDETKEERRARKEVKRSRDEQDEGSHKRPFRREYAGDEGKPKDDGRYRGRAQIGSRSKGQRPYGRRETSPPSTRRGERRDVDEAYRDRQRRDERGRRGDRGYEHGSDGQDDRRFHQEKPFQTEDRAAPGLSSRRYSSSRTRDETRGNVRRSYDDLKPPRMHRGDDVDNTAPFRPHYQDDERLLSRATQASDCKPEPSWSARDDISSAEVEMARKRAVEERLAAMQASAASLSTSRAERVKQEDEADQREHDKEMEKRMKSGGVGPKFLREQEKHVFGGMDLAERMKRSGKVGMVGE